MSTDDDADEARAIKVAGQESRSAPPEIVVQSLRLVQAFVTIRSAEKRQAILDLVELSARATSLDG
ncbi:hypothetical protein [Bradyrhizobium prioriisuperbiae]|uniref:hypothetical protein n=1 Tax=Bradyrhizobium prioriisuperbiae TaxID=2854389 RepID=UPI0028EC4762|nr:hypothetical protein [Bradyrhizobium prioritasuperba]